VPAPPPPLQLLWVNLIMDTMGALALATEDPNPELLNDKVGRWGGSRAGMAWCWCAPHDVACCGVLVLHNPPCGNTWGLWPALAEGGQGGVFTCQCMSKQWYITPSSWPTTQHPTTTPTNPPKQCQPVLYQPHVIDTTMGLLVRATAVTICGIAVALHTCLTSAVCYMYGPSCLQDCSSH
jgi:hypothetical protein